MTKGVECSGYKSIPPLSHTISVPCAVNWRQLPAKGLIAWAPLSALDSTTVKQGQVMVKSLANLSSGWDTMCPEKPSRAVRFISISFFAQPVPPWLVVLCALHVLFTPK